MEKENISQEKSPFSRYKEEVLKEAFFVRDEKECEKKEKKNVSAESYAFSELKREMYHAVAEVVLFLKNGESFPVVSPDDIEITFPPSGITQDFSVSFFRLAKKIGVSPAILSKKTAELFASTITPEIRHVFPQGPYLNIEANKEIYYEEALDRVRNLGEKYGESDVCADKTVFMDYSSPNIAKPIGVGHLRSTVIGQALSNIYEKTGATVIRDNHLGDWGTQFGKLVYALDHFGDSNTNFGDYSVEKLKDLYVRFGTEAKENPEMEEEARTIFRKMEDGDPRLVELWQKFRDISIEDFKKVYKRLGVKFDLYLGESYFAEDSAEVANDCLKKGLAEKAEGGAIVVPSHGSVPSFLLGKTDGSSLYAGRDLASIRFREQTFHPDSILYIVGSEQEINFEQVFGTAKSAGYADKNTELEHIDFGMVLGDDGKKMSTRNGTAIELSELLRRSVEKAKEILEKKEGVLSESELSETAEKIGTGAIIYNDLRQTRTNNITFDWNKMLDLEGGSAVYLQYTYARIFSLLQKVKKTFGEENWDEKTLPKERISYETASEFDLAKSIAHFSEIIIKAQKNNMPHMIALYLEDTARLFNRFYNDVSLLETKNGTLRRSRALLAESTATVIKNGLTLLGIQTPEKM